jgi:hypothetical protein
MKKRFVAPVLRVEADLAVLTLGETCSGVCDGRLFDLDL